MLIGYARVSASHQNFDRQIAALRAERCECIFREKASGKDTGGRPLLEKAIDGRSQIAACMALPTTGLVRRTRPRPPTLGAALEACRRSDG